MSESPTRVYDPGQPSREIPPPATPPGNGPGALLRLLRPSQWSKNLLVFAALVFAERLYDPESFLLATLAFVSFCLAASSVYVLNDLLDAERDRLHPVKCRRPIAAGQVGAKAAGLLAGALTLGALGIALWVGTAFTGAIVTYLGFSHFYSFGGKNLVILDAMLIAAGFVIRAVGGAVAIAVPSSDWFILCTLFLAVFLGLSKRRAEMLALGESGLATRPVLQKYDRNVLSSFIATSMAGVLMSYAMYVLDVRDLSGRVFQPLELTIPFVIYGVFRYHLLVERGGYGERPEEAFLRDRPFQLCVFGFGITAIAAIYLVE